VAPDPQPDSWLEEIECLARQVHEWFRQATNRFEAPSEGGCRAFAFYLMAFRHPVEDKTPDTRTANHSAHACPWHFGQCRLRQEL